MRIAARGAAAALAIMAALMVAGCALQQEQYPAHQQPDHEAVHEMEWNLDPWR